MLSRLLSLFFADSPPATSDASSETELQWLRWTKIQVKATRKSLSKRQQSYNFDLNERVSLCLIGVKYKEFDQPDNLRE